MSTKNIIEKIDDDLILRRATPADAEALAQYNGKIHAGDGEDFAQFIADWIRELTSGKHPTTQAEDFTIVEHAETGEIISSLCLIGQTWSYEGIQLQVGRPELVSTHADYRRRGLVRKQFDLVHRWSAERGQVMQIITGIPWFYRQFGYEMAVNLGGRRQGFLEHIPALKDEEVEPYHFRPVEEKDISFITELYCRSSQRSLLTCVRDENLWHYEAFGRNPESDFAFRIEIITTHEGERVGYLMTHRTLIGGRLPVLNFELIDGVAWSEVIHPVLRRVKAIGEQLAESESTEKEQVVFSSFSFGMGTDHPVYEVIPYRLPRVFDPYAYYVRVPDVPGFLHLITPVLEERLAKSVMTAYSGELKLNFYTDGVTINFEKGKIKNIEAWEKPDHNEASAHFPNLTFLQLLFGYRDASALEDAYADIYYPHEFAKPLLKALFPHKPSYVFDLA